MNRTTPTESDPNTVGTVVLPYELVVPVADVYLVGYGMRAPNDFTLETVAVMKQAKRIFGVPPIDASAFGIPQMESLLPLYGPDKKRSVTYREMVDTLLDAAEADGPVVFATYGSAMVGTLPAHLILEEAASRGLRAHVSNTVSSFDGIWSRFNIEPFFGFQIWEATAFVTMEIVPDTSANLLLPQANVYGVKSGPDASRNLEIARTTTVAELRDHLLKFYPPDHRIHHVKAASGSGESGVNAVVETIELKDLDQPGRQLVSSLLVPRAPDYAHKGKLRLDFKMHISSDQPSTEEK
ncbi:uncharacterized protein YabN with tetrapyrrole methylase and pyrophosphatase domain [Rhodovulum sulfidophilum]|uniref:SAM-dependent methyltransferase n=1 Tax=Rhodovulum sulfidophilum TaxID=35806 RepID=UPI0005A737E7|nr:SAM-dependent methyltransferase [Rhodovulum sulfidophilum]ANB33301.1 hypothetical protein A6W98_03970 [Rhodovulum sulfidophilum DSM 1374]ANB37150.1 hypothetical protein A6024_03960 [Rhodovulum sulfidophilum]MCW2305254.1 uncharacterized protein YabN with tetrapyrrole methylase and pyrophosphatase domain [Rhodovulum sulfidophilum]